MVLERERAFWKDVFTWAGSVTPLVVPRILGMAVYGLLVGLVHQVFAWERLGAVPAQFTAAMLVLLLVFRTNASYDRWWEARKLWGGIVNQSRNLAIAGLTWGPPDARWREAFTRWAAAFPHVCRRSLRGQRVAPELERLLGAQQARAILASQHMPTFTAGRMAALLRDAVDAGGMERFAFLGAENERARLIDHLGGCERILKTPLPYIHTVKLRRFVMLYLFWLPFAVVGDAIWLPAVITALVAYPLLAIDEIAVELQDPFSESNLSHLPLEQICKTIEGNLLALLAEPPPAPERIEPAPGDQLV
ncbi:bestrophin family protein [Vulgatibacter sp.]|uniref:bestrophin family protein n=1 Tax=Vulgatibacter sp. TaxID=1971226 RepID=UPI0035666604